MLASKVLAGRAAVARGMGQWRAGVNATCGKWRQMSTVKEEVAEDEGVEKRRKRKVPFLALGESIDTLDESHEGLIFEMGREVPEKLCPEGMSGDFRDDMQFLEQPSLMVRKPFLTVLERMRQLEKTSTNEKDMWDAGVLTGERGCGKSVALNHILMRARSKGWLTMFIPDCREWVTEKGSIEKGTGTAAIIVPSKRRPGMFAQPLGAQTILKNMKVVHEEQLKTLPIRKTYDHNLYKGEGEATLMNIIERGLKSAAHASDALYDLRMELGEVEEFPVLIAVDQLNALSWPTCFYSAGKPVAPTELLFSETFRFLDKEGNLRPEHRLKNGIIVGAPTGKYGIATTPFHILDHYTVTNYLYYKPFEARTSTFDRNLVKKLPKNVKNITVDPLSAQEIRNYVINLKKQKILQNTDAVEENQLQTIRILTKGNAKQVRDYLFLTPP